MDKSFVHGIESEKDRGAVARAIIVMAHSLGLVVTAEGVETEKQVAFLESHGCDRLQGDYFSAPRAPLELSSEAILNRKS